MTTNNDDNFTAKLAGVMFIVPLSVWHAWVTQTIWGWFLVPVGLPSLTLLAAWGLRASVATLVIGAKYDDSRPFAYRQAVGFLVSVVFLGIAAAVHWGLS